MSFGQEEQLSRSTSRSRQASSKMKVLVRSHAVQEETSPPRRTHHFVPPDISVTSYKENATETFSLDAKHTSSVVSSSTSTSSEAQSNASKVNCLSSLFSQNLKLKEAASYVNYNNEILSDSSNKNCRTCGKEQEESIVASKNAKDLTVNRSNVKQKLRQQSSSQSSFEEALPVSPCFSQDSSTEQYTDTSGADLSIFIPETLNKNFKDRTFMLRIEQELINLAKDEVKTHYKFPPMSSYQRMLVHRCAAYFGMDHNIESSGKCVVVNKTKTTRIPEIEFNAHIKRDIVFSEEPTRSILKRDSNSTEECQFTSPDRQDNAESRRSRSFEEREEEYAKIRRRIFDKKELCLLHQMQTNIFQDGLEWSGTTWDGPNPENLCKLQLPEGASKSTNKLVKATSEEVRETSRPSVAKSLSFGGYRRSFNRGDSMQSTLSTGSGYLTKQDSTASSTSWRLSPTSSGYRSQSYISESVTPSPSSTPNPLSDPSGNAPILWAVTDMHLVPKGSVIINPQTGEAFKNQDGTIYHFDPESFSSEYFNVSQLSYLKQMPLETKNHCKSSNGPAADNQPKHHLRVTSSSSNSGLPYSSPRIPFQQSQKNDQHLPEMRQLTPNAAEAHYPLSRQEEVLKEQTIFYSQKCSNYGRPFGVPHPGSRMRCQQAVGEMDPGYYVNSNLDSTTQATPLPYQSPLSLYYHHPYPAYQKPQDVTPLSFCFQQSPNYLVQNYSLPSPPPPPPPMHHTLPYISNPDLVPVFLQHSCSHSYQPPPPSVIYPPNYHNNLLPQNLLYSNSMYSSLGPQYNTLPPYKLFNNLS